VAPNGGNVLADDCQGRDPAVLTSSPLIHAPIVERLSGNSAENMMVAYALRHGKQEIPHGSVRRRMALHQPPSARSGRTRTPQASRPKGDPRRRLLRLEERLPLAVAASRVPALEDRLRLV
jgi:hypothetical protein